MLYGCCQRKKEIASPSPHVVHMNPHDLCTALSSDHDPGQASVQLKYRQLTAFSQTGGRQSHTNKWQVTSEGASASSSFYFSPRSELTVVISTCSMYDTSRFRIMMSLSTGNLVSECVWTVIFVIKPKLRLAVRCTNQLFSALKDSVIDGPTGSSRSMVSALSSFLVLCLMLWRQVYNTTNFELI